MSGRWNKYVGLPFAWNGYTEAGVSCWGLIVLAYEREFGIVLPRHTDAVRAVEAGKLRRADRWVESSGFQPVSTPGAPDVIHMSGWVDGRRTRTHCGIYIGDGDVLHAEQRTGAVISRLHDGRFLDRMLGVYRHANWMAS